MRKVLEGYDEDLVWLPSNIKSYLISGWDDFYWHNAYLSKSYSRR